ncbi:MAG: hypothetical protein QG570_13 [Patescibacteria group bacterium]|nr:hypothetical protein [Patescibacteria group bacterium]
MKILFQSRVDLYSPRGGDTIQMEKTKEAIEKLDKNIQIDIVADMRPKNIDEYDLVHLFNLDWICETYGQLKWAKKHGKKVILSAIHHSESEVKKYEDLARYDIRRIYNALISSQSLRDEFKNLYRSIFNLKKLEPTIGQLFRGIRNEQRYILENSDLVLVQTKIEADEINKDFNVNLTKYYEVVNGVDAELFTRTSKEKFENLVKKSCGVNLDGKKILLSVGRVEARKNQLTLINIFNDLQDDERFNDFYLVFIGGMTDKSYEYTTKFNSLVKNNDRILYLGPQTQDIVASAMRFPGIFVHTSWFETTGLVCLEALLSEMNVVSTSTRLKEYVGDNIVYCNPDSPESIKNAILEASRKGPVSTELVDLIIKNYSWENTAAQTLEAYKKLKIQ